MKKILLILPFFYLVTIGKAQKDTIYKHCVSFDMVNLVNNTISFSYDYTINKYLEIHGRGEGRTRGWVEPG